MFNRESRYLVGFIVILAVFYAFISPEVYKFLDRLFGEQGRNLTSFFYILSHAGFFYFVYSWFLLGKFRN